MRPYVISILLLVWVLGCQSPGTRERKTSQSEAELAEITLSVGGMFCPMCEASIEKGISQLSGIDSVRAVLSDSAAFVRYNPSLTSAEEIRKVIENRGYRVKDQ